MKYQNMNNNKSIHQCLHDLQKILKTNILMEIWIGFHYVLVYKDKLYLLTHLQEIGLFCEEIDTNSWKESYEKIFNFIMKMLHEKYNFCIDQYQ